MRGGGGGLSLGGALLGGGSGGLRQLARLQSVLRLLRVRVPPPPLLVQLSLKFVDLRLRAQGSRLLQLLTTLILFQPVLQICIRLP